MSKRNKEQEEKAANRRMGTAYQQSREGRPEDLYFSRKSGDASHSQLDFNQNPMQQFQTPYSYTAAGGEASAPNAPVDLRDLRNNPNLAQPQGRLHEKKLASHHRRGGIIGRKIK